ncbi:MAG: biopolymer transporter ExbD [Alphaproteobacteria bacterium]|nr:biopolymer transporter ExbD [Alphaproteobacteria bacterium]
MGMTAGNGHYNSPKRQRRSRNRHSPIAEINMTPMVDVMLVLLIIFMVSAPLLTAGVPIELPETQAAALESDKEPLSVTIDVDGKIFIQDAEVEFDDLVVKLTALSENGFKQKIFVRGDQNVSYGEFMRVIGHINSAGFKSIGLVSTSETNAN